MGSIEVYDYNQQKWIPHVPDPEKLYQHFKDMRDGYVVPDHRGRYRIGSGAINRRLAEEAEKQRPIVNMVTPVAQAVEMAKSEVDREKQRVSGKKRKRTEPPRKRKRHMHDSELSL